MISASFEAPAGEMFVTHAVPDGFGNIELQLHAIWVSGPGGGFSPTSISAVFENLVGSTPLLISSTDFGGEWIQFDDTFIVAPGRSSRVLISLPNMPPALAPQPKIHLRQMDSTL